MWGSRVVIPSQGRERVLEELHQCHPGINRMKAKARSYVWWPCLDKDMEKKVLHCHICQSNQCSPSKAPLHPWEWPKDPWRRLHIDYAGPFTNRMFLVVIDAHSKWLEVIPTTSATGQVTVSKLRQIFATHGIPETCVTDNGPAFVSEDFAVFMHRNGIRHITTAPYHPASNGQAKRAVQIFKRGLEKMNANDLLESLQRFLFSYRTTPQTTTSQSPAELLMGCRLVTAFDLLKPEVGRKVRRARNKMVEQGGSRLSLGRVTG